MTSPTQRSLAQLRKDGYLAAVVEKFNMFAHVRQDLFGVIDLVAISEASNGVLGVQTTSISNVSARIQKCLKEPAVTVWLKAGNRFEIWGWDVKKRLHHRNEYRLRIEKLVMQGKSIAVISST